MGARAIDLDLSEHRERDIELGHTELIDIIIATGLLCQELITRKAEDDEPSRAIALVQLLKSLILRRKAAFARRIYYQYDIVGILAEPGLRSGY